MGCTNDPKVKGSEKEQLIKLKNQLKLKASEVESKINAKNKEVEKYLEQAKLNIKSGNKFEAKRQIKKKQFNQKIVERLQSQIQILDDQLMVLENTEVNKEIADTIKSVYEKIKLVDHNINNRELEKYVEELNEIKEKNKENQEEFKEIINQGNEADPDISDELELMEAEINGNIPKANNEQLVNDNKQTFQQPAENLVFL